MSTHYFSTAVQSKKKKSAKNNEDSISQEEIQKSQRRQQRNELRKERRSIEIERHRHLSALEYTSFDVNEDLNVPIDRIVGELQSQYHNRLMMVCGDVVDSVVSCAHARSDRSNENVARCLQLIKSHLKQEKNGVATPPVPELNANSSLNSSLIEFLVQNPQSSTFKTIVSLLNQEVKDSYNASNTQLCLEIVDTIYLMTKLASSEQLQTMAKTLVHEPLVLILDGHRDVVLCTKTFFCLSFITSHCKDLRIFLIENGFASIILKHSQFALTLPRNNEENIVNYGRSVAYSVRVVTQNFREKLSNIQFTSHIILSLNNLMQLNDDLIKANVYWSLSELASPESPCNSEYIQKSNLVSKLMEVLISNEQNTSLTEAVVACLASITMCGDAIANAVINCDFVRFDLIDKLVKSNSSVMQHQTVVILINLVNSNPSIIMKLTKNGIFEPLLDLLHLGEYKSQKELTNLLWCVVLKGSPEDSLELLKRDVISSLSIQLTVTDPDLILTTLHIYEHFLKLENKKIIHFDVAVKCEQLGVIDRMENLVTHPNQVIVDTCYRIYDDYYSSEVNSVDTNQSNGSFTF